MFKVLILSCLAMAVTSLGINCRGSFYCWDGSSLEKIKSYMDGLIDPNREYNSGENIVCYRPGGEDSQSGFCLFLQDTKTPVKGNQIFDLTNALLDHGCKGCGSVPVDWKNSNDPSVNGILTMNYVGGTSGCEGLC